MEERKVKQLKVAIPILKILHDSELSFDECYSTIKGLLIAMELKMDFGFPSKKMFRVAELDFQEEINDYEKNLKEAK